MSPSPIDNNSSLVLSSFALAGDGRLAVFGDVYFSCGAEQYLYDVRNRTFLLPNFVLRFPACRGNAGASADGGRLLTLDQFAAIGTDDVWSVDQLDLARHATGIHQYAGVDPVLDRTGSRIVLNKTSVYDGSYAYLGELPATTLAVALSPDGSTAYAYDASQSVVTYDVSVPAPGGTFTPAASVPLAVDPGRGAALFNTGEIVMKITTDGRRLFIGGNQRIAVQPVP